MPRYSQMAGSSLPTPAQEARGLLHQEKVLSLTLNCGFLAINISSNLPHTHKNPHNTPAETGSGLFWRAVGLREHGASGQCGSVPRRGPGGYLRKGQKE